ncbi:hypothetical protein N7507_007135 [Penicillium longicatenatum]|nr:hypothetical protein N7507_007135 [Penicillium longicatenatum]
MIEIKYSARTQALALPEIVISILQQMDMRTLVIAQRVSRMWVDLIRGSTSLQQCLFFLPVSENCSPAPPMPNQLLGEAFPSFFPSKDIKASPNGLPTDEISKKLEYVSLQHLEFVRNPVKRDKYLRPEASWRRMLTHQPPIHTIGNFSTMPVQEGFEWKLLQLARQEDGLRMEILLNWLIELEWYEWNSAYISTCLGGSPVDAPVVYLKSSAGVTSYTPSLSATACHRDTRGKA